MEAQSFYNDKQLDEKLVYFFNCLTELEIDTTSDLHLDPNSERSEIEKLDDLKHHLSNVLEARTNDQPVQAGSEFFMQSVLNRIYDVHKKIFNTGEYYSIQYMDPLETDEQKRIGLKLVINGKEEKYPKFLMMKKEEIDRILERFKKNVAGKKYIYFHLYELFITEQKQKLYYPILQNKPVNQLAHTMTKKPEESYFDKITGEVMIALEEFILRITNYKNLPQGITTSAVMLLDIILYKADHQGKSIEIPLKEYMHIRGLSDVKSARQQLDRDLKQIFSINFECNHNKKFIRINMFEYQAEIKEGKINILLTTSFYNLITNPYLNGKKMFMFLPAEALKINLKHNPNSYYFIRYISLHKHMNLNKHNEHRISVKSLIESNPNFTDRYLKADRKRFSEYVLDPFQRDLNILIDIKILTNWEYETHPKAPETFDEFLESYIIVTWNDYPEEKTKKLQQKRKKHAEKRKEQKAAKKKLAALENRLNELENKPNE